MAAGLVLGKIVGITAASWPSVRTGLGRLPEGAPWSQPSVVVIEDVDRIAEERTMPGRGQMPLPPTPRGTQADAGLCGQSVPERLSWLQNVQSAVTDR